MKRLEYIDIAKGLGILLVILGHISTTSLIHKYIYAFHMPLFFILSGYTFNSEKYKSFRFNDFIKVKARAFLLPYFIYAFLNLLIFGVIKGLLSLGLGSDFFVQIKTYIFGILYSIGDVAHMPNCSPLWFLTCLFVAEVFYYLINKYIRRTYLVIIACACVCAFLPLIPLPDLPWNIDVALIAVVFIYIGDRLKKISLSPLSLLFLVPVFIVSTAFNSETNVEAMMFGIYPLFLLSAISGSLSVIILSMLIKSSRILQIYGQNTICIIGFNYALNTLFSVYGAYVTIWYCWEWVFVNIAFLAFVLAVVHSKVKPMLRELTSHRTARGVPGSAV